MRSLLRRILMLILVLSMTGCALYGNEKQYDKGDWYFFTGSGEIEKIKENKLALRKLETSSVQSRQNVTSSGKTFQGYLGLVANLSQYRRYNFKLFGPETKSYFLGPGERVRDYLIPGVYAYEIWEGGVRVQNPGKFHVSTQQSVFQKENYHWYIYTEW